jgi:hypothetical protein
MTSLAEAIPTATMDPWMGVDDGTAVVLFGYCNRHPILGGQSWTRSSALIGFDPSRSQARTASGSIYQLGQRITTAELPDEEARTAFALLIGPASRERSPEDDDARDWLQACKIGRGVGIEPPSRHESEGVRRFVETFRPAYLARRRKHRWNESPNN